MLVKTTLVKALYFKALLVTACPQLWNATMAMGTRTSHPISSLSFGGPELVTIAAAPTVRSSCAKKDAHSTQRRFGEKKRWNRLKTKDPAQNEASDVPDLIQRVDSVGCARPRPMYTVFPSAPG